MINIQKLIEEANENGYQGDNKVIHTLNAELREVSVETLANVLEDCNYTKGDKLVEALLVAKVLAEKIGGKAILELI